MKCTRLTAATAACLLSYHVGLGHVSGAREAPLETARRQLDSPRTVTASISAGLKPSGSRPSTPTILHLATVQEQADMDPELTEFRKLMQDCGATFYLEQTRDMTAFMPTNEAVHALLPVDIHKLPWEVKWRILQYHIVPQEIVSVEEIPWGASKMITTWEGSSIKIQHKKQPGQQRNREGRVVELYLLNDIANIVSDPPRIENSNGASYKINRVLIPQDLDLRAYEANTSVQRQQGVDKQREHQLVRNSLNRLTKKPVATSAGGEDKTDKDAEHTSAKNPSRTSIQDAARAVTQFDMATTENGTEVPEFLRNINHQHARWNQDLYLGSTPRTTLHKEVALSTNSAGASPTESPPPSLTSTIKPLAFEDLVYPQHLAGHDEAGAGVPAAGLLHPSEISSFQNYMQLSSEPLLVGSGVQEDRFISQTSTGATFTMPGSSSPSFSTSSSAPSSPVLLPSPAAAVSASLPSSGTGEEKESLFDSYQEFQSYVASPSITALGLAEGLLPEEELVTQYWSKPRSPTQKLGTVVSSEHLHTNRGAIFGPLSKLSSLVNSITES